MTEDMDRRTQQPLRCPASGVKALAVEAVKASVKAPMSDVVSSRAMWLAADRFSPALCPSLPTLSFQHLSYRWSILIGLVVVCWALAASFTVQAQNVDREVLPNGMVVVVETMSINHVVALRLDVAAGSDREGDQLGSGIAGLTQRLLLRQPGRHSELGTVDGDVSTRSAYFHFATTDQDVVPAVQYLAQLVQLPIGLPAKGSGVNGASGATATNGTPTVPDAGQTNPRLVLETHFNAVQQQLLQQLLQRQDQVAAITDDWLRRLFYQVHPARVHPWGDSRLVSQATLDQVLAFYRRFYTAPNMTLTVVGNVTMDQILPVVKQAFAPLPTVHQASASMVQEPRQFAARFKTIVAPVPQPTVVRAWRTVSIEQPRRLVFDVIAALLATPAISPLYERLIEGQLATSLEVAHEVAVGRPGWLRITYQPLPQRAADAHAAVAAVLQTIAQQGVPQSTLAAAKKQVERQARHQQYAPSTLAHTLATWELVAADPQYGAELWRGLAGIDAEAVRQTVHTWLHANGRNRSVLHIEPVSTADTPDSPVNSSSMTEPAPTRSDVPPRALPDVAAGVTTLVRDVSDDMIHVALVLKGGAAAAPVDRPGVAQVHAALLALGSVHRAGTDLQQLLAQHAMQFEVEADLHETVLRVQCFPEDLAIALAILIDPLRQPRLSEADLTKAKQALRAPSQADRDWRHLLERGVARALFADHYVAQQQFLSGQDYAAIDLAAVSAFHEQLVHGANMHLAVYGAVTDQLVQQALQQELAIEPQLTTGTEIIYQAAGWAEPATDAQPKEELAPVSVVWDQPQAAIALVWPGPDQASSFSDHVAFDVVSELLVGVHGVLTEALAQQQVAVTGLQMQHEAFVARGTVHIRALLADPGQRLLFRQVVTEVMQNLLRDAQQDQPVLLTEDRLSRAAQAVWRQFVLDYEDQWQVAEQHARWSAQHLLAAGLAYPRALRLVTVEEAARAINSLAVAPRVIEVVPVRQDLNIDIPVVDPGTTADGAGTINPVPDADPSTTQPVAPGSGNAPDQQSVVEPAPTNTSAESAPVSPTRSAEGAVE